MLLNQVIKSLDHFLYDSLQTLSCMLQRFPVANNLMRAGDDAMTVHGRFHTIIATNQKNASMVVGSNNIDPSQLTTGDTVQAYGPDGQPIASATVSTITATDIPPGVPPSTPDTVFGGTYGDDSFYLVRQQLPL